MSTATATLSAHGGAIRISRGELFTIPTPPKTATHTPVPHSTLVDLIVARLEEQQLFIERDEYAVMTDGLKLFGVLTLKHQTRDDFSFALGLRTSNDKKIPVQLVAGGRIFVCDNMAFSGEAVTLDRKHTSRLDIRLEINGGIDRAIAKFGAFESRVQELKTVAVQDVEAKALILDAALKGVMPLHRIPEVAKNYFTPPHTEFEPRTMWSLHNAFTEAFKVMRTNLALESNMALGKLFDL